MSSSMKIIWFGILLVAAGCNYKTPQQKFTAFVNDPGNKITQKITVGKVTATVKWMPAAYRRMIDSLTGQNDEYNYFHVKFEKIEATSLGKEKIMYMDFDIQKDFVLAVGRDSILPAICQRIQNGLSRSFEYMLAFEKQEKNNDEDFTVVYNDKIFGIGTIAFVFKKEDIKKIPILAAK